MLLMGDEVGRSQGGNNNTWCQNSPLGWMIWHQDNCDLDLKNFVKKLLTLRKNLPEFFSPTLFFSENPNSIDSSQKNLWVQWHGIKLNKPDWGSWSHTISYSINQGERGSAAWIGLNAYSQSMIFELPSPVSPWCKILDTGSLSTIKNTKVDTFNQSEIKIESKSLVLMIADEYSSKFNS